MSRQLKYFMKTKKPKIKKFIEPNGEVLTIGTYDSTITVKLEGTSCVTLISAREAMKLAQHIVHCALYVHEKYEKKE